MLEQEAGLSKVCLTGLPGSGKHRLQAVLCEQFGLNQSAVSVDAELTQPTACGQVWCVIDIRSTLKGVADSSIELHLKHLVEKADGVIFNFTEAAELDAQSFWSKWVRQQSKTIPIVRVLNQRFPEVGLGFESNKVSRPACFQKTDFIPEALETYRFDVNTIHLEHLLMGLDSSKHNLGMKIWRVQAVVQTFEYENLVAIEGTPNRWDTYAAEADQKLGWIKVQGFELQQAWLNEIIQASSSRT